MVRYSGSGFALFWVGGFFIMVALAQNERFLVVKDSRRLVFEHKMTTLSGQKFSSDLRTTLP